MKWIFIGSVVGLLGSMGLGYYLLHPLDGFGLAFLFWFTFFGLYGGLFLGSLPAIISGASNLRQGLLFGLTLGSIWMIGWLMIIPMFGSDFIQIAINVGIFAFIGAVVSCLGMTTGRIIAKAW